MKNRNYWRSYGRIVSFQRDLPTLEVVTGIRQDGQQFYDRNPFFHGSNGTYVVNEPTFWHLMYVIYTPGPDDHKSFTYEKDMSDYMVNHFMPARNWSRVSSKRLAAMHEKFLKKKIQFMSTKYLDEGEVGEEFIPCGFDTWVEFFDDVLKDVK